MIAPARGRQAALSGLSQDERQRRGVVDRNVVLNQPKYGRRQARVEPDLDDLAKARVVERRKRRIQNERKEQMPALARVVPGDRRVHPQELEARELGPNE